MNLLVIVIDSLRQDHVGCYGQGRAQTPNMDRLAADSAVFSRCWSESLPTIPVRRAMHTLRRTFPWQQPPSPKGIYNRHAGWLPIPEPHVTIAEHLDGLGYVKALIADTYHMFKPAMNFHRFFDTFEWVRGQELDRWRSAPLRDVDPADYLPPGQEPGPVLVQYLKNQSRRRAEEDYQSPRVFQTAIDWLRDNAQHERFMLWVDSFDPHEPWEAPRQYVDLYDPGYEGKEYIHPGRMPASEMTEAELRHVKALYAAVVSMVDHWVGRLLDTLDEVGRRDDTVVVLVSDHGKIVGEFDAFGMNPRHTSRHLYAVPCMVRHPGGEAAGTRHDAWAYNTDLMTTALGLLGVPPMPGGEGIDLWPMVTGRADPPRDHLVCAYNAIQCVWQGEWLLTRDVENNAEALYDLNIDPEQKVNMAPDCAGVRKDMIGKLETVLRSRA